MSSQRIDVAGRRVAGAGLLAAALQTVAQPVWVVDRDGLIRFANAAAVAALGYSDLEELIGRDSHQTIHHHRPDGRPYPAAECPMLRPRTTGQTVTSDVDWFFRRDGSMFRVSYVSAPLEMADGRGAVVAFTDIESRLRAEEALRERAASLAEQQEALRRVPTLVARGLEPEAVFRVVADEVHALLGADTSAIVRFESDGTATAVVAHGGPYAAGARVELDPDHIVASVRETGQAARFDRDDPTVPVIPEVVRAVGIRSGLASPIVVDGELWGAITVGSLDCPLPAVMERRLADFTELVAAVISNAQAREDLRRIADEQVALRRVTTLVAQDVASDELFGAVAREVGALLGADYSGMIRYEPDPRFVTTMATWAAVGEHPPAPTRSRTVPGDPTAMVADTGKAVRVDDWANVPGLIAEFVRRELGVKSSVGSPIAVNGSLWGALAVHSKRGPLPPDTELRLLNFTELVATAIANTSARTEMSRLAEEQAALRRVATLVAQGGQPSEVFDTVAMELVGLLRADHVVVCRYEPGCELTVLAYRGTSQEVPPGTRINHEGDSVEAVVWRTERSARVESYEGARGTIAELARAAGVQVAVGAPVVVDGRLWGVASVGWNWGRRPPADAEERMAKFAELLDTAIANADSRDQLTASRARLVTEADEARRRVVRDLHDGAQQSLVQTVVTLKLAQRALEPNDEKADRLIAQALTHAQRGNAELRELAHGILPAVLAQGGLRSGITSIVSRLDLPVEVEVPSERFPAEIEASAYFVVAEALTNVVKHSHAERAEVRACMEDGMLRVEVRDDGVGGADPSGHGLVGLGDRVTAIGGQLVVESLESGGTLLAAKLPVSTS